MEEAEESRSAPMEAAAGLASALATVVSIVVHITADMAADILATAADMAVGIRAIATLHRKATTAEAVHTVAVHTMAADGIKPSRLI